METYLLIITKKTPILNYNVDNVILHNEFTLLDENHVLIDNITYEFTYLIFSKDINVTYQDQILMIENKLPITNFLHQTSVENIIFLHYEDNLSEDINMIIEEI